MENIKFNSKGLIPVIVQQYNTNEVLMLAWMNKESLDETIKTKKVCFWSRSSNKLWRKGETSGNIQEVVFSTDGWHPNAKGYKIIAIEQTKKSISLKQFSTNSKKLALIFGNEIKGVSKDSAKFAKSYVEIHQYGIKKSMNVSVTAGIVLWTISSNNLSNDK